MFCCRDKFELLCVKISIYIFSLLSDFFMNAILFSDDVISQKYNNNGQLSTTTSFMLSVLSNILSWIIATVIFKLTNYAYLFNFIMKYNHNEEKMLKDMYKVGPVIRKRLIAFFILIIPISIMYIYFFICFCGLFNASQMNWFINSITSLFVSLAITFGMTFIVTVFRYVGTTCKSKEFYNVSLYLNR